MQFSIKILTWVFTGLGVNVLPQGGGCTGLTPTAEHLCYKYLSVKTTPRIPAETTGSNSGDLGLEYIKITILSARESRCL